MQKEITLEIVYSSNDNDKIYITVSKVHGNDNLHDLILDDTGEIMNARLNLEQLKEFHKKLTQYIIEAEQ